VSTILQFVNSPLSIELIFLGLIADPWYQSLQTNLGPATATPCLSCKDDEWTPEMQQYKLLWGWLWGVDDDCHSNFDTIGMQNKRKITEQSTNGISEVIS